MCLTFSATSTTGSYLGYASLVSRVNIFSERCCTVALSWVIPSFVAISRFSISTFILVVIFLFSSLLQDMSIYNFLKTFFFYRIWFGILTCNVQICHYDKINLPFSENSELRTKFLQCGATPGDLSYLSGSFWTYTC